jgi:hypothetical protein
MVSVLRPPFNSLVNNQVKVIPALMLGTDIVFARTLVVLSLHDTKEIAIDQDFRSQVNGFLDVILE